MRRRRAVVVVRAVMVVPGAPVRPQELVGRHAGQIPALERGGAAVARGLAVVVDRGAADAAVGPVPAAHPHAPREEQLEEQPLELLAEYHVDDEVHGRVDGDQQVADFDQLVHRDAVERLGHVRYERPHVAQQEHDDHAQQHGGQPDLLLLQPRQPLPFPVGQSHLQHPHTGFQLLLLLLLQYFLNFFLRHQKQFMSSVMYSFQNELLNISKFYVLWLIVEVITKSS